MAQHTDELTRLLQDCDRLTPVQRMANALPYLSKTEQAIITYVLRNVSKAVNLSAAALASEVGVGTATVFRLFRKLGYAGWVPARDELALSLERFGATLLTPVDARSRVEDEALLGQLGALRAGVYDAINVLLDACLIDEAVIHAAAEAIYTSDNVLVCGVGPHSTRLAEMVSFGFQSLGLSCTLWVHPEGVDARRMQVRSDLFTPQTVVFGISHSGENEGISRMMAAAKERQATTIALTNYASSRIAKHATIKLVTGVRETSVHNFSILPRISQLLVIHVLISLIERKIRAEQGE